MYVECFKDSIDSTHFELNVIPSLREQISKTIASSVDVDAIIRPVAEAFARQINDSMTRPVLESRSRSVAPTLGIDQIANQIAVSFDADGLIGSVMPDLSVTSAPQLKTLERFLATFPH